jgi:ketosteroid isomerase-like protein
VPVLAIWLLAGCGGAGASDEQQVRATLDDFRRATSARDYKALCERILAPALVRTAEQVGLTCETALAKGFEDVENPQLSVGQVTIGNGKATAQVRSSAAGEVPSEDTVELVEVAGRWRISRLAG